MVNSCGQFIKPVCEQFGFSRSRFVLYTSLQTLMIVFFVPLNGAVFRRVNPRLATALAGTLAAACWAGLSLARELAHFYLLGLGIGLGLAFIGTATMNMFVSNWFIRKKGLAIGLTLLGSGLGAMVWNPLLAKLIIAAGPQEAYRISGLAAFCLMLPFFFLFRFRPEDKGFAPYNGGGRDPEGVVGSKKEEKGEAGMAYAQAVRTRRFWAMTLVLTFFPFSISGVFSQLQPFLTDLGFPALFATSAISVGGLFQVLNKPVLGLLHDKLGTRGLFVLASGLCFCALFLATLLAHFSSSALLLYCAAVVFGCAAASPTIISPLVTGTAFGRKDFITIYGTVSSVWYLGPTCGPLFAAAAYDLTGSYVPAFIIFMAGLAAVLFLGLWVLRDESGLKNDKPGKMIFPGSL